MIRALHGIVVRMDGHICATTATQGQPGSVTLLGKTALGQMGLGVDPVENRLIRQVARLLSTTNRPTF